MLTVSPKAKFQKAIVLVLSLCLFGLLTSQSCSAAVKENGLTDSQLDVFSANNIMFYNPGECVNKTDANISSNSCYKIDTSTPASDFWYAEGCIQNGTCTGGVYYGGCSGLVITSNNPFICGADGDTKTDDEFGGLQYIYAENYDFEYDGAYTKMTKNGGNSTRKYYWIVLPDQAYTNGFGDTYVATFENLSEPIYFIVWDAHACEHQLSTTGVDYCTEAEADPEGVTIRKGFLGAMSRDGGSFSEAASIAGKMTSLCRINGSGEVLAHESNTGSVENIANSSDSGITISDTSSEMSVSNNDTASTTSSNGGDGKVLSAVGEIIALANKNGSTYTFGGGHGNQTAMDLMLDGSSPIDVDCTGFAGLVMYKAFGKMTSFDSESIFNDSLYKEVERSNVRPGDIFAYNSPEGHGGIVIEVSNGVVTKIAETGGTEGRSGDNKNIGYSDSSDASVTNMNGENGHFFRHVDSTISDSDSDCNSYEGDYPQYYQGNYAESDHENSSMDWTTMLYGRDTTDKDYNVKTVAETGCGLVSMAMLATVATGRDIYPQDIAEITKGAGWYNRIQKPYSTLDKMVGDEYGLEVIEESYTSKDDAYAKIKDYMNRGYMIHLSGEGIGNGFSNYDTDGHYIGLFKIDSDDNVWVANSNSVGNSVVPLQDIINIIHHGEFGAIKGSGAASCSQYDYCSGGGSSSVGDDGLTIEQAKTLMMNYGEDKNGSSSNLLGAYWDLCNGGGSNCVTFSVFFMLKFTTITAPSDNLWGNGYEIVDYLKARSDVDATYGTEPKVYGVFQTTPNHTAVVLGHHDGKWIVGHASCKNSGVGRGNGGDGDLSDGHRGDGSGFIAIEESDNPADWQWVNAGYSFAYPSNVDTAKIAEYLESGV